MQENIIRNQDYLVDRYRKCFRLDQDRLEFIDIFMLPHYGNLVCLEFYLSRYRHAIHNDTHNIGAILHNLSTVFGVPEDGMRLCELSQSYKPVRFIWVSGVDGENCIGIGHAWEDKFVLFEEFHLAEV
jgi:hypothetical protein